jgi:hypothetical protein
MSSALPPEIIRLISACLVNDEGASNRTLQLMSFCGVCQRWREFGRETRGCLEFDATDSQHGPKSTLARFRRAPIAQKRGLFNGASRLLTGTNILRPVITRPATQPAAPGLPRRLNHFVQHTSSLSITWTWSRNHSAEQQQLHPALPLLNSRCCLCSRLLCSQ